MRKLRPRVIKTLVNIGARVEPGTCPRTPNNNWFTLWQFNCLILKYLASGFLCRSLLLSQDLHRSPLARYLNIKSLNRKPCQQPSEECSIIIPSLLIMKQSFGDCIICPRSPR